MINLFIFSLRIAFRLLPFSSMLWVLLMLSLLTRLCKTDCQFIMLEIPSANDGGVIGGVIVTMLFER